MKKNQWKMALMLACALSFTACNNDDSVRLSTVDITTTVDTSINGLQLTEGTYTFENVNTSAKTTLAYPAKNIELADGLYHVTFVGQGTYTQDGAPVEVKVQGVQHNVTVTGGSYRLDMKVNVLNTGEPDFVIAEVFSPGTYTEANKPYLGDQYIRIYNNSDKVLYADGLILLESKFVTTDKPQSIDPDIMSDAMAVQTVIAVPGSGTDHPIQPGAYFTICDNAIDHTAANPNSINLSKADFEWYIESKQDQDNPAIPNMDIYYCYTKTIWIMAKQGNRAYAIGRLPKGMTKEDYLKNNTYAYSYVLANGTPGKPQSTYQFPNQWIIDAVNIGAANSWQWNVTASTLDMGHTYFGMNNTPQENIGKGIVRKASYTEGTRIVLQDTNNSSVDFTPATTPSLFKQ